MFTNRRLSCVYSNSEVIEFDKDSKFVILSDLHRGDDSISDEFTRNQVITVSALEYYYRNGYTYIEAGDGDEIWEYKEFRHIRTAHTDVFTEIKKFFDDDRFIFLFGNHNIHCRSNLYLKQHYYYFHDVYNDCLQPLFPGIKSREGIVLRYQETGQDILVVHGHQGDFLNDQFWVPTMISLRYFWKFMHLVGFRNPASPAKNQSKRHKIEKAFTKWIKKSKVMLICGHTHRMKFPKKGQLPYFNSGCCIHTKGIAGIEIVDGKIMLIQWRVQADNNGVLTVRRCVVRGPKPIEYYNMNR
ncbi:MAG: serine/threonine protein phosphatase [bacterium]|nr:serine/threonine protein phosphatase [bacterium]